MLILHRGVVYLSLPRLAKNVAEEATSLPHLLYLMEKKYPEEMEKATTFTEKLKEACSVQAVRTEGGLDLEEAINNGDCVYIIGSSDVSEIILVQRMLLLRVKQIVEHRDRLKKQRHVTIFMDELKYFLSNPVLNSLGMIRDHGCNMILAHQGPGDLYDVPSDLSGQACFSAVVNNTNIKVIYKLNVQKDREEAAKMTGTKRVQRDSKNLMRNEQLGEIIGTDSTRVMDMQVPLYDANYFSSFNERVGVIFGTGVPKLCFTSPILTEQKHIEINAAPECENYEFIAHRDQNIDTEKVKKLHAKEAEKPRLDPQKNTETNAVDLEMELQDMLQDEQGADHYDY